jgi:multiple sugar transport system ATP-binding protein
VNHSIDVHRLPKLPPRLIADTIYQIARRRATLIERRLRKAIRHSCFVIHSTFVIRPVARLLIENLTKIFPGGVRALDRFSLDVADGEFVVVVGPSGSGKSTLLRIVAGLERASSGTVRIGNRVVNSFPPRRRDVAMAFQHPALYPHLSLRQNLAFPLRFRKRPRIEIESRVRTVAEQLSIAPLLDRKPATISGGERQRVALGRVLVREAQCNLFDEPLAHLDRPLVEQLQTCLLESHRRRPTTTLFVTHDQAEALALGERVVVLSAGRIQQVAPLLEIYDRPANRFVAGFFGSPAMNFLIGRLIAEKGRIWFGSHAIRIALDEPRFRQLETRSGSAVVAGFRPQAIRADPLHDEAAASRQGEFTGVVRFSQSQGDRVFHQIEMPAGQRLVARGTSCAPLKPGSSCRFQIDASQLHFFAAEDEGRRLEV